MYLEKPEMEFVAIDYNESMLTLSSNCVEDQMTTQGGGSCIGNMEHSTGEGCNDTAPLVQG